MSTIKIPPIDYQPFDKPIRLEDLYKIPVKGMERNTVADRVSFHLDAGHLHHPHSLCEKVLAFYIECNGFARLFLPHADGDVDADSEAQQQDADVALSEAQDDAIECAMEWRNIFLSNCDHNAPLPHCTVIETEVDRWQTRMMREDRKVGTHLFLMEHHPCAEARAYLLRVLQNTAQPTTPH